MGIKDLMKRSETALSKPDVQPGDADRPARLVRPITAPGAAAAMRPAMLELEARAEHAPEEVVTAIADTNAQSREQAVATGERAI